MDEEIKKEFEKVWKKLGDIEGKINEKNFSQEKQELKSPEDNNFEEKILKFCNELDIERKDFDLICYLRNKEIFLLKPIEGKNESERQVKTSLVLLTIKDSLFDDDFIGSSEISTVLMKLGIKSISNLSTNLNKERRFFIPEGVKASKKFGFRITVPGKIEGKKIIKSFLEKDGA